MKFNNFSEVRDETHKPFTATVLTTLILLVFTIIQTNVICMDVRYSGAPVEANSLILIAEPTSGRLKKVTIQNSIIFPFNHYPGRGEPTGITSK